MRYYYTAFRMAKIQNTDKNKCCWGWETGIYCWWECKMVWLCWKRVLQFLTNLKYSEHTIHSPLCGIYPKELEICQFSSVRSFQSLSRVQLFVTPWTAACQASLSITNARNLLKLMSIESVMPSSHLILCCPLLLLPSIFTSIKVFSSESVVHNRWPKYWSFSFSISPSNEYSELTSFRIDWFDLLAVQGTLESLLQHHSSKASILQHSDFFVVQLSHPYMSTGKTIALTRWTFAGKCLCF